MSKKAAFKLKYREEWLIKLADEMRPWFKKQGFPLPEKIRANAGWASTRATRVRGECWHGKTSEDGYFNISVALNESDSIQVAGIAIHELAHAATGVSGHKGAFVACLRAVGIDGKPKYANELNPILKPKITAFVKKFGKYPHGAVNFSKKPKQGTRMIKLVCTDAECGYVVRTTKKWIENVGVPICCCGAGIFGLDDGAEEDNG